MKKWKFEIDLILTSTSLRVNKSLTISDLPFSTAMCNGVRLKHDFFLKISFKFIFLKFHSKKLNFNWMNTKSDLKFYKFFLILKLNEKN